MALLLCERHQNWLRVVTVVFRTIGIRLRFLRFLRFFENPKSRDFLRFFAVLRTFSRTMRQTDGRTDRQLCRSNRPTALCVASRGKNINALSPLFAVCLSCLLRRNWFVIFVCSFAQLILAKIIEIVATRRQILRLKCTKFDFGWGSAPDPAGGAYSAPPDP